MQESKARYRMEKCSKLFSIHRYFIFVKKLGEFDRVVVFRLGKMIGVKGPGGFLLCSFLKVSKNVIPKIYFI